MGQLKNIDLPPGVGISGHVAKTGESIISNDVAKDPRWYQKVSEKVKNLCSVDGELSADS